MAMTNFVQENDEALLTRKATAIHDQSIWDPHMNHEGSEIMMTESSHIIRIRIR
jgi:hypothetical protein